MTDRDDDARRVIKVPRPTNGRREMGDDEQLVAPADLGSASRSCLAILIVLLIIGLLICAFLVLQPILD